MTAMITEIFYPLLLSYGMAFLASAVSQGRGDAASVTSLTAVFTILAAGLCYRQECRKRKEERMKQWQEKPMPLWSWFALAAAGVLGNVVFSFFAFFFAADFGIVQCRSGGTAFWKKHVDSGSRPWNCSACGGRTDFSGPDLWKYAETSWSLALCSSWRCPVCSVPWKCDADAVCISYGSSAVPGL